jgi:5-methylcytosine-specific restriction endonuclease McrA
MANKCFKGLKFSYKIDGKTFAAKFDTVEDFLETSFPKNNNPLAPENNTEIFCIKWRCKRITANRYAKTVSQLKDFFNAGNVIEYEYVAPKCKKISTMKLLRKSTHNINDVYNAVKDVLFSEEREKKVLLDGDKIKGNSHRYQTFFTKGTKCVYCGIEGKYFAKEKCRRCKSYHLNLYALDNEGNEVLMTKDHIIPKSKGGIDDISNYQTMCEPCNMAKGNKME